jgi:hypothetical protein
MSRTVEEKLLNPRPGGKIAEARDYGIDLTLLVENLRLTPEQRLEKLQQAIDSFDELRREAAKSRIVSR